MKKGKLFIVCGPSGVGKKTLLSQLVKDTSLNLVINTSYTSRAQRKGEIHGKDYHFITKNEFIQLITENKFIEYAFFFGEYYGTLWQDLVDLLHEGKNVILEIEILGFRQIEKKIQDFTSIFIYPPSEETLKKRLYSRSTENSRMIEERIQKAHSEMKEMSRFHHKILNDSLPKALDQLTQIIKSKLN